MKKIAIITTGFLICLAAVWYFLIKTTLVMQIDDLIGKNYDYAHKIHFQTDPDDFYQININDELNEFDGGIYNKTARLTDTIVSVYTWNFLNHSETIWIGATKDLEFEIIDALIYSSNIEYEPM